jgi:hypothetical protein
MSYLLNYSQWKIFEAEKYSYKNLITTGVRDSGFLQNTLHQLEDYVSLLNTNVLIPLSEKKGGVLDNGFLAVVFFNSMDIKSGTSYCKTGTILRDVEPLLNLEWKPAEGVQLPVVFIIQDIPVEFRFAGIPFINHKGEKTSDDYYIVQNDAYLQVFGPGSDPNWAMAPSYIKTIEPKLAPIIKQINIERIGPLGKGLIINRISFGGSCIPDQEEIMVRIISKLFG